MGSTLEPPKFRFFIAWIFRSTGERRLRAGWRLLGQFMLMLVWFIVLGGIGGALLGPDLASRYLLLFSEVITTLAVMLSIVMARRFLDRRSFASLASSSLLLRQTAFAFSFFMVYLKKENAPHLKRGPGFRQMEKLSDMVP